MSIMQDGVAYVAFFEGDVSIRRTTKHNHQAEQCDVRGDALSNVRARAAQRAGMIPHLGPLSGGVSRVTTAYMERRQLVLPGQLWDRILAKADAWRPTLGGGHPCSAARAGSCRARP
jgi:hypothetical protein